MLRARVSHSLRVVTVGKSRGVLSVWVEEFSVVDEAACAEPEMRTAKTSSSVGTGRRRRVSAFIRDRLPLYGRGFLLHAISTGTIHVNGESNLAVCWLKLQEKMERFGHDLCQTRYCH